MTGFFGAIATVFLWIEEPSSSRKDLSIDIPLNYKVASATSEEFTVEAMVADKPVTAKVQGVCVELLSDDGAMGHTFRFMTDDPSAVLAKFAVDAPVVVTLSIAD